MPYRPWAPADDRLIRTLPPARAVSATHRTLAAVYRRRCRLGLSTPKDRNVWTPAEDRLVLSGKPREVRAALPHRTMNAIYHRRAQLRKSDG